MIKIRLPKRQTTLVKIALSVFAVFLLVIGQSPEQINSILGKFEVNDPGWHRVVAVHDGDTIDVDILGKTETIRFIGVDTPETHHPSRPVQCFGKAATKFTTDLLDGEEVRLEADELNSNRDRYDRLLRYVYLRDGTLVNSEIIKNGFGFAYLSFNFTKLDEFQEYERQAEINNVGLWNSCEIEQDGGFINTQQET